MFRLIGFAMPRQVGCGHPEMPGQERDDRVEFPGTRGGLVQQDERYPLLFALIMELPFR
jgi:hypothetical protein